jgi:hypothetical protein
MIPSVEVRYADEDHLHVLEKRVEQKWKKFDMHVVAIGLKAKDVLSAGLTDSKGEIYVIGDAKEPRKGVDAIREGAEIGNSI